MIVSYAINLVKIAYLVERMDVLLAIQNKEESWLRMQELKLEVVSVKTDFMRKK